MTYVDEMTTTTGAARLGDSTGHAVIHGAFCTLGCTEMLIGPIVTPSRFLLFVLRASSNTGDALNK